MDGDKAELCRNFSVEQSRPSSEPEKTRTCASEEEPKAPEPAGSRTDAACASEEEVKAPELVRTPTRTQLYTKHGREGDLETPPEQETTEGATGMREQDIVYGKTISEWNQVQWEALGRLDQINTDKSSDALKYIGVYRLIKNGRIIYVGCAAAVGKKGVKGLRKLIKELQTSPDKVVEGKAGKYIGQHRAEIAVEALKITDIPDGRGVCAAGYLELYFCQRFRPTLIFLK